MSENWQGHRTRKIHRPNCTAIQWVANERAPLGAATQAQRNVRGLVHNHRVAGRSFVKALQQPKVWKLHGRERTADQRLNSYRVSNDMGVKSLCHAPRLQRQPCCLLHAAVPFKL